VASVVVSEAVSAAKSPTSKLENTDSIGSA